MSAPRIQIPDDKLSGLYADGVHTRTAKFGFVLDFLVRRGDDDYVVTQRIRLDPSAIQSVLVSLSEAADIYDKLYGDPRAGLPGFEPPGDQASR